MVNRANTTMKNVAQLASVAPSSVSRFLSGRMGTLRLSKVAKNRIEDAVETNADRRGRVMMWQSYMVLVVTVFAVGLFSMPASGGEYRVVTAVKVAEEVACMPSAIKAPNGDLLVAFSMQWEGFPWGDLLKLVVSKDNGATWSKPRVIWRDEDLRATFQVGNSMQTLSNGDIILIVKRWVIPKRKGVSPDEKRPARIYDTSKLQVNFQHPNTPFGLKESQFRPTLWLLRSRDNGETWAKEDMGLTHSRFGRPIETRDGRLIMPMFGWYLESRDFGKTWGRPKWFGTPFDKEINLVEAADGTLFTIMRQNGELGSRRIFGTTFSRDAGKTWSKWRLTTVRGKMPDLRVLPSGRILMAVGFEGVSDGSDLYRKKDRPSFVTLFYSDDHGQTWEKDIAFVQAELGSSVVPTDSPCLVPLDSGKIFVVIQAADRSKRGTLAGYSEGQSLIGNVIEPVNTNSQ